MRKANKPWLLQYDRGVPAEIVIPDLTLVDLFKDAVTTHGSATCTITDQEKLSYLQIDDYSDRIARFLLDKGLNKGDRVGVLLLNSPAFVISYFGILKAGGVVMALNPDYRPNEVRKLAIESGIRILILQESAYQEIKPVQPETFIEMMVVVSKKSSLQDPDDFSWKELLDGYSDGNPIVNLVVANVYQFSHWLVNIEPGQEKVLVAIPLYHVYGMVLGMNLAVKIKSSMILISNPRDMDGLLHAAEEFQATIFPGVPNIYAAINHYPKVLAGEYDLSSIKACISGSATLPARVKREFEALTKGHLVEGYGLSEAPTATHCNPILGENREGSIGLPLPNVECKIVDLETGTIEMDVGEPGELIIQGPQVMSGYHQRPEETEIALRDGWLYTGDVAKMDQDGYFYLVDRKKDVIKVGGFQVWPNEIEAVLRQHPNVREAAVAGVSDPEGKEAAKAWIVLQKGAICTSEEIKEFCKKYLTGYKIPRYIEFRDDLPKTTVGKVLRWVLVSEHSHELKEG